MDLDQVLADIGRDREIRPSINPQSSGSSSSKPSKPMVKPNPPFRSQAGEFGMAGLIHVFDAVKNANNSDDDYRLMAVTIGRDIASWCLNTQRVSWESHPDDEEKPAKFNLAPGAEWVAKKK
uniref:DUF550 domain-containing protein n=1 Tax=Steinernema glaseri TaxID=37863 RepID=A0A1I8A3W8_9BILA